ncbi:MAG: bifunctional transaldolase/phosoglucose isomerase [Rhizobiales bacterium]|nr:bifunctional transaldolase/phosoglucose isomerase [Hyphomicrobiales bacterium]
MNSQSIALGASFERPFEALLGELKTNNILARIWQRDKSVWTSADENKWLGWLDCVDASHRQIGEYEAFALEVRRQGFIDALLLGMGGSSIGSEVMIGAFGHIAGWPRLRILDSTDPEQISATENAIESGHALFIVSSKSGSTAESNALKNYFLARAAERGGASMAGGDFIAITDRGSSLEKDAAIHGFRRVFYGTPDIGGRYSVLSPFGVVPAAIAGIDVQRFLKAAQVMVRACGQDVPPAENPGAQLGVALGLAARNGRDKVTIFTSPRLGSFGGWAEQLIAESTGKSGKGLIPIEGEPIGDPGVYGHDRFFIDLSVAGDVDPRHAASLAALERTGHPLVRIELASPSHIGQEFFRFEIATAVAGALFGVNPFDQPDVEASKMKTRELIRVFETIGRLPQEKPSAPGEQIVIHADAKNTEALRRAGAGATLDSWLRAHFATLRNGDYTALLAYIARSPRNIEKLQALRLALRNLRHVATSVGFGPRYLHSTGQVHKGGPNIGVFLQITADDASDLAIPGQAASFGIVKAAQAHGDIETLAERGRRVLRVHLKGDVGSGLDTLQAALLRALA